MTTQRRNRAALDAARFNARFAVGEEVSYTLEYGGRVVHDRIFAPAESINGGRAVVWLAGQRDAVSISHVSKAEEVRDAA